MRQLALLCTALLVVACGTDNPALPDGPPGNPDAPRIDAVPGTATVHLTEEADGTPGTPVPDGKIAVIASSGGAPAMYTTDASGTAVFPVDPGSQVWVERDPGVPPPAALPGGGGRDGRLYLIMSVSPGDTINLGARPVVTGSVDGTLTINYTPLGGTNVYYHNSYFSGCTDAGTETAPGTIVFTTYAGCAATPRELVISAYDTTALTWQYLRVPDVAPVPGTITATGSFAAGTTYQVGFTNQIAEVYSANTMFLSPGSWDYSSAYATITAGAGTATVVAATLPTPAIFLTELYHQTLSPQFVAEPEAVLPASYTVDGAGLLPFVSTADVVPGSREVTWTQQVPPGAVTPQMTTTSFNYYDSVDFTAFRWTVYAPGTATSFVLPDVPDALTTHDLQPTDFIYPDLWLINVVGGSYPDLLTDLDLYRDDPTSGYRPTTRTLLSGGYGGGKLQKHRR